MRILILATDAYGGHGGIALYTRDLAKALATAADEVVVVPRIVRHAVEELPPNVTFAAGAARGNVAYFRELRRVLRGGAFDLVICGHINLLPAARIAARHPLLMVYGIEAWRPHRRAVINRLVPDARAVVSISDITLHRFRHWSHYGGPSHVLPNAVDIARYGIRPKRADLVARYGLEGKRVLMTVGRIIEAERYKGFDEVIGVLGDLPPDVVYVIAGSGDDAPRLARKAAACGVGDRVVFTGFFPEEEKADLFALADVYVMPSRGEGFGFVLLEALASGVPVVASKHDGGREAVRDGALGLLVDPSNPAEVRCAIVELLARGERRVPEGLEHFSVARFEERVRGILQRV